MAYGEGGPIYEFLKGLSEDPARLDAYRADPDGVMDEAEISEHHKEVLRSGDHGKIEKALRDEGLSAEAPMFIVV